jgi:hypothetical protein
MVWAEKIHESQHGLKFDSSRPIAEQNAFRVLIASQG